jgi:hypothetical protein
MWGDIPVTGWRIPPPGQTGGSPAAGMKWSNGILEYWVLKTGNILPFVYPSFHYFMTPLFQSTNTIFNFLSKVQLPP